MTASNYYSIDYYPHYGRLHGRRGRDAWCPNTTKNRGDYLQIDMGAQGAVCAVATQGEAYEVNWTTRYELSLSRDGVTWFFYQEDHRTKVIERLSQFLSIVNSCWG